MDCANHSRVRLILFSVAFVAVTLRAQDSRLEKPEIVAELAPMIVSGSFELQRQPAIIDLVIKDLDLQFEQKRKTDEEIARAPLWNARFWNYIPIHLGPGDDEQFFTPGYLSLANQDSVRALELSQKRDLFEASTRSETSVR
jgi:hypothetical protein